MLAALYFAPTALGARRGGTVATVVLHGSPLRPEAAAGVVASLRSPESFCTPVRCTLPVTLSELDGLETFARSEGLSVEPLPNARRLIWHAGVWNGDTAAFEPASIGSDIATPASAATRAPWVVLFQDYPRDEWRQALADLGLLLSDPVPILGTVVYGTASAAAAADRLDFVDSVVPLPPAVRRFGADGPGAGDAAARVDATVEVFDTGEPLPPSVSSLLDGLRPIAGGTGEGAVAFDATLTAAQAVALSRDPRVLRVTRHVGVALPSDERSNRIFGGDWPNGQTAPAPGSSWPSSLATNSSPYAWDRYLANLSARWPGVFDLADETIGLVDTGIGAGYPDCPGHLASGSCRLVFAADATLSGNPSPKAVDRLSHGTHVSSLAAGSLFQGRDAAGYAFTQGVAQGARIAVSKHFATSSLGESYRDDVGEKMPKIDSRLRYAIVELGQMVTMFDQSVPSPNARLFNHSWNNRPPIDPPPPQPSPYEDISQTLDIATRNRASVSFNTGSWQGVVNGATGSSLHVVSNGNPWSLSPLQTLPPANAKNVLSVGMTLTDNTSPYSQGAYPCDTYNLTGDPRAVSQYNADGLEFRFKPDLVAPGTRSYGERSAAGCSSLVCNCTIAGLPIVWDMGTSFAAPLATGAAALVREWRAANQASGYAPSPALTRAILVAAARDLGDYPGQVHAPSRQQGWGGLSLDPLFGPETKYFFQDEGTQLVPSSSWWYTELEVEDPSRPVVISLVWTDAASAAGTAANYVLRNDLDLWVTNGTTYWYGNDYSSGYSVARSNPPATRDRTNNVERITIPAGLSGRFFVWVEPFAIVANILTHKAPDPRQDFVLAVINAHEAPQP